MTIPDGRTCQENQGWLDVYRALIQKYVELVLKELDEDHARVPTVDILEQLY
jgi:hypothetical protein